MEPLKHSVYRVEYFASFAHEVIASEFAAWLSSPVLVHQRGPEDDNSEFSTRVNVDEAFLQALEEGRILDPNAKVFIVAKRPGANHFSQMIMIGRAHNCDIVIHNSRISKLHAYITRRDGASKPSHLISDGPSRNGTMCNGTLLSAGQSCELEDGDIIKLGPNVVLQYFSPRGFWEKLNTKISG